MPWFSWLLPFYFANVDPSFPGPEPFVQADVQATELGQDFADFFLPDFHYNLRLGHLLSDKGFSWQFSYGRFTSDDALRSSTLQLLELNPQFLLNFAEYDILGCQGNFSFQPGLIFSSYQLNHRGYKDHSKTENGFSYGAIFEISALAKLGAGWLAISTLALKNYELKWEGTNFIWGLGVRKNFE